MKEIESNFVANHVFLSTILLAMIYWIAAFRLPDGMEWQVDVPDEVDDELQRLDAVAAGRTLVAQHALEVLDPVHHAVLVVVLRPLVRVLRPVAVPRIGEALRVLGNIDDLCAVRLYTIQVF